MFTTLRLLLLAVKGPAAYSLLIAAILVLIITLMLRLIRHQSRRKRADGGGPPRRARKELPRGLRADAPEEIVRWEVQMQELARDLKAELDSKAVVLGHLIREADRAARRLEAHLADEPDAEQRTAGPLNEPTSAPPADCPANVREEIYMLADYGFLPEDIAARVDIPAGQVELILQRRQERK